MLRNLKIEMMADTDRYMCLGFVCHSVVGFCSLQARMDTIMWMPIIAPSWLYLQAFLRSTQCHSGTLPPHHNTTTPYILKICQHDEEVFDKSDLNYRFTCLLTFCAAINRLDDLVYSFVTVIFLYALNRL